MDKMTFNRLISPYNRTLRTDKQNEWLVIHYVGAVSSAENNAKYFYNAYRGASAHYFVDEKSIWQVVEDYNDAWHVGGAKKYYNSCRNNNSIAIEMCCKKNSKGEWYFEEDTINNTLWLAKMIVQKYNIPLHKVVRHYDVTHKNCPAPYVEDAKAWEIFKIRLQEMINMADMPDVSLNEKIEKIKQIMNIDDNTIQYDKFYKYGIEYIDKQYKVCVDAEKWRNSLK